MWYASGDVPHTQPAGDEVDGILFEPVDGVVVVPPPEVSSDVTP